MTRSKEFKIRHANLNSIIIVVAVVLVWRMTWGLMDLYLFPNKPMLSYIVGGLIGLFILWIDDFKLSELHDERPDK